MKRQTKNGKGRAWKYWLALVVIVLGIVLGHYNVGREFLGFASAGNWLIYVGVVIFAVVTLQMFFKKERITDERTERVGYFASRVTFLFVILFAFVVMVADGIKEIIIPYSLFMSYLICGIVLVYFVTFRIMNRRAV